MLDQPAEAEAAYGKAIDVDAGSGWLKTSRGLARARAGRWKEAIQDFVEGANLAPDDPLSRYWVAHAQIRLGDLAGFRSTCAELIKRFGTTDKPDVAVEVAFTCAIAAGSVNDFEHVLRFAKLASSTDAKNYYYAVTNALTLYRAGRLADATQQARAAELLKKEPISAWFILAMIQQREGKSADANRSFEQADQSLRQASGAKPTNGEDPRLPWMLRLRLELLRLEAAEILKRPDTGKP